MSPCKLLRYSLLGLVALLPLVAAEAPSRTQADNPPAVNDSNSDEKAEVKTAEVTINVLAILATDLHDCVDERLSCIARVVQEKDAKLTGFQINKIMCEKVAVGTTKTFKLIDDQTISVMLSSGPDANERVQLVVIPPGLGTFMYDTCYGKFITFITKYRTPDNQQLIVAMRVKPCKCNK
jgi:hypothetical protein